jgi:hypothetical protein
MQVLVGTLLGLGIALGVSAFLDRGEQGAPSGALLSEHEGHLTELVIQYETSSKDIVLPVYREFLRWLESDVTVYVLSPDEHSFKELVAGVGSVRCKLQSIVTGHPMTAWARDRWLALAPFARVDVTTLMSPREEAGAKFWPERKGDMRIAADIAAFLPSRVGARRSRLYFDGGDFLADNNAVFVMPRVLPRNIQVTVKDRTELEMVLAVELQRPIHILLEAPDHHAGMFMASVGSKTMLVGDPSLAGNFVSSTEKAHRLLPGGADSSLQTQRLFDAVAEQSRAAGYRVVRIPTVVAPDGRTFLTYVNSIIDQQGDRRIVYAPSYKGVEAMNLAARKIWESLGYEVRPIDSTTTYRYFGALHCLVNVLSRST